MWNDSDAGDESCVAHQELEMESCSPDSWSWAPCDPSDGRSHYLLAGSTIISQGSGVQPHQNLRLPAPAGASEPCKIAWHAWCWEGAGLRLVYACCPKVYFRSHRHKAAAAVHVMPEVQTSFAHRQALSGLSPQTHPRAGLACHRALSGIQVIMYDTAVPSCFTM